MISLMRSSVKSLDNFIYLFSTWSGSHRQCSPAVPWMRFSPLLRREKVRIIPSQHQSGLTCEPPTGGLSLHTGSSSVLGVQHLLAGHPLLRRRLDAVVLPHLGRGDVHGEAELRSDLADSQTVTELRALSSEEPPVLSRPPTLSSWLLTG